MNWSKQIPKIAGWYWVHMEWGDTDVVYFYEDEYTGEIWVGLYGESSPAQKLYAPYEPLFCGPISRPGFPQ